jgi:hypothetical protein
MKLKLIPFLALLLFFAFQSCTVENPYTAIVDPTPITPIIVLPTVTVPANMTNTKGDLLAATALVSSPIGGSFAWTNSNTAIGLAASGSGNIPSFTAANTGASAIIATITVTPTVNNIKGTPSSYTITVNPTAPTPGTPTVTVPANSTMDNKGSVATTNFASSPAGGSFTWTNSNTAIGLVASGTGNVPSFTATNTGTSAIIATITVTPTVNNIKGTPSSYTITVNPTATAPTAITLTGSASGLSKSHNMGMNCMNCHNPGGTGSPKGVWQVGGTIYTTSAGTSTAVNLVVKFYTGPNGTGTLKYILNGDKLGNFYTAGTVDFTGGLYPAVVGATSTKYMSSPITAAPTSCNSCHTGGAGTAKIWAN